MTEKEITEKQKKEIQDYKDAYLRKNAEFNTFKKRKEEEYAKAKETILADFLSKLLKVKSELELALIHSEAQNFIEGIKIIDNKIENLVKEEGIEVIETNGKFNPEIHDGISIGSDLEKENEEILQTFSKGYLFKGKTLIPAKVMVNKIK